MPAAHGWFHSSVAILLLLLSIAAVNVVDATTVKHRFSRTRGEVTLASEAEPLPQERSISLHQHGVFRRFSPSFDDSKKAVGGSLGSEEEKVPGEPQLLRKKQPQKKKVTSADEEDLYQLLETTETEIASLERELAASLTMNLKEADEPVRILHITDNHISLEDDDPPKTTRMFEAFAHTVDRMQQKPTTPRDEFVGLMQKAKDEKVDLIALGGDLINYPSPSTVEWVIKELKDTGIPYVYTAGNHDWHEEGVASDTRYDSARVPQLQTTLAPLYENSAIPVGSHNEQGLGRLYGHTHLRGVDVIFVDNSNYQVTEDQLAFAGRKLAASRNAPAVLLMHIPLNLPGTPPLEPKFVCGHPEWGFSSDDTWQIEQRPRWPKEGNLPSTDAFVELVRANSAPNGRIVALLTGHVHRDFSANLPHPHLDVANLTSLACDKDEPGCRLWPSASAFLEQSQGENSHEATGALQYTTLDAAEGGYRILTVNPTPRL